MEARVQDLFDRALSLGFTDESAYRLADCFTNWDRVMDPCVTHPNHSVTMADGYAVDGCRACHVIELSNAEGFTAEGFQAAQAKRAAEYAAIEARDLTADQEAFAEAERDELNGIDLIRELTTIPTGEHTQARRAPKLKAVHAADLGTGDDKTTACGKAQVRGRVTMVPESVTCKLCKGTQRFQRWAHNVQRRLKAAEFARSVSAR